MGEIYYFKPGDRVEIQPPPIKYGNDYEQYRGITGEFLHDADGYYGIQHDPQFKVMLGPHWCNWDKDWVRPLKPLTPFEEDLRAYIQSELEALHGL